MAGPTRDVSPSRHWERYHFDPRTRGLFGASEERSRLVKEQGGRALKSAIDRHGGRGAKAGSPGPGHRKPSATPACRDYPINKTDDRRARIGGPDVPLA